MVGKGQRRREKNYRAAHGGHSLLPPPPKASDLDALPSKLRRIMDFTAHNTKPSSAKGEPLKVSTDGERKRKRRDGGGENKRDPQNEFGLKIAGSEEGAKNKDKRDDDCNYAQDEKKAKRKRKVVDDLRFGSMTQALGSTGLKRRERKKKYLEMKKNKHKKSKLEDINFPRHEEIKFGEIVEAPPKLSVVPKALKTVQDASNERLRLQAVKAYRKRKGWASRPGVQLPAPMSIDPSF